MILSRLGSKTAAQAIAVRFINPSICQRSESSVPATLEEQKARIQKLLSESLPKPYDGPERDLVNFPRRKRLENPGKVRMGFAPEEWFTFFYKKTGVTGPYLFGTGLITYLLSKEWYVIEEEFSTGVAIFIMVYYAVKKFGPTVKQYAQKQVAEEIKQLEDGKLTNMKNLQDGIEHEKKSVWYAKGQKILMEAKRENIQMQLEIEYRKRLMDVYEQTKKRLDYHLDLYNTRRKLEQKHMVDWIVNNVIKSITPEQEKEALKKCVEDLNALALK